MHAANITRYDFDDLRFDVTTNETVYYLRGENKDDVSKWIDALENTKVRVALLMNACGARQGNKYLTH
jgi:hypothetical protein